MTDKIGVPVVDWLHDLGSAVEELGYGIELIEPGRIRISDRAYTVEIQTIFLSGDTLRALLKSRKEPGT